MKKDRISKLYDGLSSEELASLAFNGSVSLDDVEIKRIIDSVPKLTYKMPDADYMRRFDDIKTFAITWGMTHWKAQAARYMANTLLLFDGQSTEEQMQSLSDIELAESRLLALENVLIAVCEKHGISPDVVRAYSGTSPFFSLHDNLMPDLDYQAEMQTGFEQLLSGDAGFQNADPKDGSNGIH